MALTLPTTDVFFSFWGDEADTDVARALVFLQLAADLFYLTTGVTDDPTDPAIARLVPYAIMDMAIYLEVNRSDLQSSYSPFSSEHIGSYSYSKQFISKALDASTGVPLFDRVVQWFLNQAYTDSSATSEWVFEQGYVPEYQKILVAQDPSWYFTHSWIATHQ